MRSAGIVSLGMAVPDRILTNFDLEKMVDTTDEWIVERTGIRQRRVSGDDHCASSLGTEAAREALEKAGVAPEDVDLIVCATTSTDMLFPSTACIIQQNLGCVNAAAFDLGAACSGFVYALVVASQMLVCGRYSNVLVVGTDVLTKFLDWSDRGTCILFGDGAGAVLLQPVEEGRGILAFDLGSDGTGSELLKIPAGGGGMPASHETVDNRLHCIQMNGREVFKFAVRIMGESAERSLARCGMSAGDVDWFVPHQANIRIIDSAARRLGISMERVFINLEKYGNTSAGSIPIALYEAYHSGLIRQGDLIVTVGFGAGLTWASSVIRWTMPAAG